jgi:regulation of enolase protein 1 (concanavalin A-like superfamily)
MKALRFSRFFIVICLLAGVIGSGPSASAASTGFSDYFDSSSLTSGWSWIDPKGDSNYSLTALPGYMRISTSGRGHDLYLNFDAPRMVQSIDGDFVVSTRVLIDPRYNYQGAGLLVWQDSNNYIRLERTLVSGIDLWYRIQGVYGGVELPYSTYGDIYFRISRAGNSFTASYGLDNKTWNPVLTINFPANNTLQVGLVLINEWQDNSTYAYFDFFERWSRIQLLTRPLIEKLVPLSKKFSNSLLTTWGQVKVVYEPLSTADTFACLAFAVNTGGIAIVICGAKAVLEDFVIRSFENAFYVLSQDPPSDDYDQAYELVPITPFEPSNDSAFGVAWADVKTTMAEGTALLDAYRITQERLQGAIEDDKPVYIILQSNKLEEFTRLLLQNQEKLRSQLLILQNEFNAIHDPELQEDLMRLATEGLSNDERQLLENNGVTIEQIEAIEELIPDFSDDYQEAVAQALDDWIRSIDSAIADLQEMYATIQQVNIEIDLAIPKGHGYWKNHPEDVVQLLPLIIGNEEVSTLENAREILANATASDASNSLASHLLAAELNYRSDRLNTSCISPTILLAQDFLKLYPPGSGLLAKNKSLKAARTQALIYQSLLAEYNNISGVCFNQ